jgi:hypothetical protein
VFRAVSAVIGVTVLAFVPGVVAPAAADSGQYVKTESGRLRCWVSSSDSGHGGGPVVVCEASSPNPLSLDGYTGFLQAPMGEKYHWDLAAVHADGSFRWDDGNIGIGSSDGTPNDLVLNYGQTYHLSGWTILPSFDGTRFTNDSTGHGMSVSIENVSTF